MPGVEVTVTVSNYWLWPMFVLCIVYLVAIIGKDVLRWKIRKMEAQIQDAKAIYDRMPKP